jgi:hypothetical protein
MELVARGALFSLYILSDFEVTGYYNKRRFWRLLLLVFKCGLSLFFTMAI